MSQVTKLIRAIRRHPLTSAFDLTLVTVIMTSAFVLALSYDLEEWWTEITPRERTICVEEMWALGFLFAICAIVFIWRRLLEDRQDREKWHRTEAELREQRSLAMADTLTGLPNRREFNRVLEAALANNNITTVYLLDLNGFKAINDNYGHATGDEVLKVVAHRFRTAARSHDIVARLGGDEFAVLAPSIKSRAQAKNLAHRFIQSLAIGIEVENKLHFVGVAIGVAMSLHEGSDAANLLRIADKAMYNAKRSGVSGVSFFDELPMQRSA